MAVKCKMIMNELEKWAPKSLAESWDNVGLSVGDAEAEVSKILVALDVTPEVITEAIDLGADMIVTHHPMILFQKMQSVVANTPLGNKIYRLIQNNISAYAMHTNLDIAKGGTNDVLAELMDLKNIEILEETIKKTDTCAAEGIGRIGNLPEKMSFGDFATMLRTGLGLDSIRLVGDKEQMVSRVGLCTGSGAEFLEIAKKECADVYVTGDIKFHEAQKALEMGICVADATHYASEVLIVPFICKYLQQVSESNKWNVSVIESQMDGQTFWHQS